MSTSPVVTVVSARHESPSIVRAALNALWRRRDWWFLIGLIVGMSVVGFVFSGPPPASPSYLP